MSEPRAQRPIVILISGRGSNMNTLIERSHADTTSGNAACYRVAAVLSDQPDAAGLALASARGIPARALAVNKSEDRSIYDHRLAAAVDESEPELVVLAGFMRILSDEFVERYAGRIMNIHPSLLPKYPGLHTHRRALLAQDSEHGATVHFVTTELDGGPAIIQGKVKIETGDDEATLAARVQAVEHEIYPLAVSWYCEGRLRVHEGKACLDSRALNSPVDFDSVSSGAAK